jgi:hypothetical protein
MNEHTKETMKQILLSALLVLLASATGIAQTASTPSFSVTGNDAAMIILPGATQSLTADETSALRAAMANVYQATPDLATAQKTLLQTGASIAAAHGAQSAGPYNITGDFSVQITVLPPTSPVTTPSTPSALSATPSTIAASPSWSKVGTQGQIVQIKAGTTVRFGAPAGTRSSRSGGTRLAKDSFDPQVTYQADTVITINAAAFGGIDPAPNYTKELDMLGTTGGVTVSSR